MTFEELGAALRAEREKRHLTIDDVAGQLKINPRLLLALEAGDATSLPHPAYTRGFIRSYASFLGFSPEEIQQWLASLQPGDLKKVPVQAEAPDEYVSLPERQKSGAGKAIAAVIILCILAGGGFWLWKSGRLPFLEMKKEEPTDIVNSLPAADTYKPQPAETPEKKDTPVTVLAPIQQTGPLPETAIDRQTAPARKEEQEAAAPAPSESGEAGEVEDRQSENEAQLEPHKVVIVATEECWVHSTADKTDTRQFSLRKGDTFALTFADVLELKLGNAGGVRIRFDGIDQPPAGTSGQVRTITFPPKTN